MERTALRDEIGFYVVKVGGGWAGTPPFLGPLPNGHKTINNGHRTNTPPPLFASFLHNQQILTLQTNP